MFGSSFGDQSQQPYNTNESYEVPGPPSDGISSLTWASSMNVIACSSWDKSVRIWEVQGGHMGGAYNAVGKVHYNHDAPALCTAFSKDSTRLFSGGCDKAVKMCSLQTGQAQTIGQHDAPIRHIAYCEELKMVITGGWDKSLKFWNGSQPTPIATLALPERVYAMDMKYPVLVVGCANRHILIYNLQTLQTNPNPYKQMTSNLKMQTRCVSLFPDKTGFAVGSVEGRVSIAHIEESLQSKDFAFKCHRKTNAGGDEMYAVNAVDFHPVFSTFATAGSDGGFVYWDKDFKQRLKCFNLCNHPITCAAFNHDGTIFAYSIGYDWSKGHEFANPNSPNRVLLHKVLEDHIKGKKNTGVGRRN